MEKTIFYSIRMNDGMTQFGRSNSQMSMALNEEEFKRRKLQDCPYGREVQIYTDEDSWKQAQKI